MGRNWAIAIGINNYENLTSLKYAKQDAKAIADWFGQEAQFDEVFLFTADSPPIEKTNPPIPTSPTYGHLRRFLRVQFENIEQPLLKSGDNLWFFFAGHGLRHRDKDYLMLSDSDPGDVEHTAIAVEYVTERLRRSGADNVVLFLDACRDEGSRGGVGIGGEKHQGVITFYSCSANQKSWEFDQLQHGSFTHALLEGLRIQGEANCATVERLDQHLRYYVPQLNARYGKGVQNPYLKAEPPYKMYFILLEQSATLKDVEPLKYQASLAENESNLLLAEQLWIRILAASRGDLDAIRAIQRIAVKKVTQPQNLSQEPIVRASESDNLPRGTEVEISEAEDQKEKQHQQNLEQYRQRFSQAVEQEFPLGELSRRELRNLQQSLRLSDEQVSQIEQPIIDQKETEERERLEQERIRQQQETERLQRQREEAERLRQQQEVERSEQSQIENKKLQIFEFEFVSKVEVQSSGFLGLGSKVKLNRVGGRASYFTENLGNDVILEMLSIPGGKFMMGTEDKEIERLVDKFNWNGLRREKPQHEVTVQPFFIGKFQITQAQWKVIASLPKIEKDLDLEPSNFKGNDLPVERVSWEDAQEFCSRLSEKTGKEYRLPTEAEWEYACRAGTMTPFYFGETITSELANYRGTSTYANEPKGVDRGKTIPVGSFPPNAFGLYGMHGNVWEWCQDNWHSNYEDAPKDGSAWLTGQRNKKVLRGGSWNFNPSFCRSASRSFDVPERSFNYNGFRVVCRVPRIL